MTGTPTDPLPLGYVWCCKICNRPWSGPAEMDEKGRHAHCPTCGRPDYTWAKHEQWVEEMDKRTSEIRAVVVKPIVDWCEAHGMIIKKEKDK